MGIPSVPVVTSPFEELVKAVAFKGGMAGERFVFVPHPVGGQSASQLKRYVLGPDPVTGRPVGRRDSGRPHRATRRKRAIDRH